MMNIKSKYLMYFFFFINIIIYIYIIYDIWYNIDIILLICIILLIVLIYVLLNELIINYFFIINSKMYIQYTFMMLLSSEIMRLILRNDIIKNIKYQLINIYKYNNWYKTIIIVLYKNIVRSYYYNLLLKKISIKISNVLNLKNLLIYPKLINISKIKFIYN